MRSTAELLSTLPDNDAVDAQPASSRRRRATPAQETDCARTRASARVGVFGREVAGRPRAPLEQLGTGGQAADRTPGTPVSVLVALVACRREILGTWERFRQDLASELRSSDGDDRPRVGALHAALAADVELAVVPAFVQARTLVQAAVGSPDTALLLPWLIALEDAATRLADGAHAGWSRTCARESARDRLRLSTSAR